MSASLCPRFHKAIELVGSRWTGAVLQVLLGGRKRFSEVRASIPDISDRMLSERLHALEVEGLVARTVLPEPPIRVEYALTEKGMELQATLVAVAQWAERWIEPDATDSPEVHAGHSIATVRAAGRRTPARRATTTSSRRSK